MILKALCSAAEVAGGFIAGAVVTLAFMREMSGSVVMADTEDEPTALARAARAKKRLIAELRNWFPERLHIDHIVWSERFRDILKKYEDPFDGSAKYGLWDELNAWLRLRPELQPHLREELKNLIRKYKGE